MKVSVIIPIYNVENYITKCARSLFAQTLNDIEFIFVNDASPDNSVELLNSCINSFPERREQIKIISHEVNKGLPTARNTGLSVAKGEYVFHCDSDDYVEPNMLEVLYYEAKKKDADFLWCDWFLSFEKTERYMKQPKYSTPLEALRGMLCGAMKFTVWNKLVRRSLYNDNSIEFASGYSMGEDMTMMMLCACAKKVVYLPRAFYHYVKFNTNALTQTFSERYLIDLTYNVQRIEHYLQHKYDNKLEAEIAFLKLNVKLPFLISNSSSKYRIWNELYPESNPYIGKNKMISFRANFIQWCAKQGLFTIVRIHYILLQRIFYGIIYK